MALKPEISLGVGLALGTAVFAIHQLAGPSMADIRTLEPGNKDVSSAERTATWGGALLVSTVSILAKDPIIFMLGGSMVIGAAWFNRHSNFVSPIMSALPHPGGAGSANSAPGAPDTAELQPYVAFSDEFSR
ncbi:hypothetical protein ACGF12_35825 [Kitasatospora sp. NPDC048296]|uniref:hypothetical protein n=1 Tax=Kitasatospora sp. NPDC048296 TaxID=3364048 RepID=UPI00371A9219